MAGYLQGDLWLELARTANARAAHLAEGLRAAGAEFLHVPDANMIFAAFPRRAHRALQEAGAMYHLWSGRLDGDDPDEMLGARLVCDWSITEAGIDRFLGHLAG